MQNTLAMITKEISETKFETGPVKIDGAKTGKLSRAVTNTLAANDSASKTVTPVEKKVEFNLYNPVAEPSSKTINRALQNLAVFGEE